MKIYELKCRQCGLRFSDDAAVNMSTNPIGLPQKRCPSCGGILDHALTKEAEAKRENEI